MKKVQEDKDKIFFFYCLLMHKIQMQYSRDTIHIYSGTEPEGVALLALPAYLPFVMFSFTQNRGGGAPSLDPPLHTCLIATPYKGFQSQDYIPIILK